MPEVITQEVKPEKVEEALDAVAAQPVPTASLPNRLGARKGIGLARRVGVSGITMSILLPIGVIPRVMQSQDLDHRQQKIEESLPRVSTKQAVLGPAERKLVLPGS